MMPFLAVWDGHGFEPLRYFRKACTDNFKTGKVYRIMEAADRSAASHRQYFAAVADMWNTLPEKYDGQWATPDHLRKWALIKTGFRDVKLMPCQTKAEAVRLMQNLRIANDYCVTFVDEANVVHYCTAKSQRMEAMSRREFQASKTAVLEYISQELLGLDPDAALQSLQET